jgi:hypothetical protein
MFSNKKKKNEIKKLGGNWPGGYCPRPVSFISNILLINQ